MALSSGLGALGIPWDRDAKMAADEINSTGGVKVAGKTYPVKIESYDGEALQAKSVAGLRRLKQRYDIAVVETAHSSPTLAVLEINEELGVLMVTLGVAPKTTQMGNKLVLRPAKSAQEDDRRCAQVAADTFGKVGSAIMSNTTDWGKIEGQHFVKEITERGGKILVSEWFAKMAPNFSARSREMTWMIAKAMEKARYHY